MVSSGTTFIIVVCQVIFMNTQPLEERHPNNLIPTAPYCGQMLTNRVHGGSETNLEDYPWLALLFYKNGNETIDKCGGSLINDRYVLTAAHCATNDLLFVRLGEHNTTSAEDCVTKYNVTYCNAPPQDIRVESFHIYEEYSSIKRYHDIALIRLSRPAKLRDSVKPICLPNSKTPESADGANLVVAGWGFTTTSGFEHGNKSDVKLQVRLPLVSETDCGRVFLRLNYNDQFCAGGVEGEDACEGDSGGPIMEEVNNVWYARGIVSFGRSCGIKDEPGVYTRIRRYVDWIHEKCLN